MDKNIMNGHYNQFAEFETPFADIPILKESTGPKNDPDYNSSLKQEWESPFSNTYGEFESVVSSSPRGEEYVQLLAELNDAEFSDSLHELAAELESTWTNKISNETAMGDRFIPFVQQNANEYFMPILNETEKALNQIQQHFSGHNLADHSEAEMENFFMELEFSTGRLTPVQDQFIGKILKKAKSVVKAGIKLAKKGIAVVGKIIPIGPLLEKLKGLIKPLLERVLKFAINKLPKDLQVHAQNLANKFLKLQPATTNTAPSEGAAAPSDSPAEPSTGDLDSVQSELDNRIAQLVYSEDEYESDQVVMEYENALGYIEKNYEYETGGMNFPSIDIARQELLYELKNLPPGANPAPAIEKFLPAVFALKPLVKTAISIIGRPKIINFFANMLAKLVSKFVPENVAKQLSASIVDSGLRLIGFETNETEKLDLGYEAIINTIQETIQGVQNLNEENLQDQEALTSQILEAFETAVTNNFPSAYLREDLHSSADQGVWYSMPRNANKQYYKKYSKVFNVTIFPRSAKAITTFSGLPLSNFLRDRLGLNPNKPIKARMHLYEAIEGTWLSRISKFENVPGLNSHLSSAWSQIHLLTPTAASHLLKEPSLGKESPAKFTQKRDMVAVGQRFYYLEIQGANVVMAPKVPDYSNLANNNNSLANNNNNLANNNNNIANKGVPDTRPSYPVPRKMTDAQLVVNFAKAEIKLNYFFSEEEAKNITYHLNNNDVISLIPALKKSMKTLLDNILIKDVGSKVKIIHEAYPELYLDKTTELESEGFLGGVGIKVLTNILKKLSDVAIDFAIKALDNYFKARASEFKLAQQDPQDGVTVRFTFSNLPGMGQIKLVFDALKSKLSVGSFVGALSSSVINIALVIPEVEIFPGKKFL